MRITEKTLGTISRGYGFFKRQPRDWKITVGRMGITLFFYRMVLPYMSIYTMALGATGTQLGLVNSIGMGITGLVSPFLGWGIDRIGVKKIYLIGISVLAISYLTYSIAQSWPIIIVAMIAYWMGQQVSVQSCATVCGNSLANEDRATGMSLCETFTAGLFALLAPMLGARLVHTFGGVNVSGIRPLFFISLGGIIGVFFLILTQLSNRKWLISGGTKPSFFQELSQVFMQGRYLKRWLIISSIGSLPWFMIIPFTMPFAHEIKGAEEYVLGAMVTAFAIMPLLAGIPIGRLADRIGRKKVLYFTIPIVWSFCLMLIWAPNPGFLITAGALQGFIYISTVIQGAMTFELVPPEQMGRWMGIIRFFRLLLAAVGVFLTGIIWDKIGPQYVFLIVIGLDVFIRVPLLIGMPETLHLRVRAKPSE